VAQSAEDKASYNKGRELLVRAGKAGNTTSLGKLVETLEGQGVDLADLGSVRALWHKTSVDADGVEKYAGSSVMLAPSWDSGPKWQPVDHPAPVKVSVPKARPTALGTGWSTAVILPDPQIGFRRLPDGSLDPFHDPRAIDVALQILEYERPDLAIWLGDYLDLAQMGRFRMEPEFAATMQPAIDYGYGLMARTAALAGEVRLIEGNHDKRITTYIIDNAMAAYGVRRGSKTDEWPVLSVPYLLRLDELGVSYVDGYPNGATYITDKLAAIHGVKTDLTSVANESQVSIIQGHMHRAGTVYKTRNSRGKPVFTMAASPGCLCRIDGGVPSGKSSITVRGVPAKAWENWQQGVGIVRYHEDGRFAWEQVMIFEGTALHAGRVFTHTPEVVS